MEAYVLSTGPTIPKSARKSYTLFWANVTFSRHTRQDKERITELSVRLHAYKADNRLSLVLNTNYATH